MWVEREGQLFPILPYEMNGIPWHSNQMSALPTIYVQNASLEIGWNRNIYEHRSISGFKIQAFKSNKWAGFDLNEPLDWYTLENLVARKVVSLPKINTPNR